MGLVDFCLGNNCEAARASGFATHQTHRQHVGKETNEGRMTQPPSRQGWFRISMPSVSSLEVISSVNEAGRGW